MAPSYRRPKRGTRDKLNAAVEAEGDEAVFKHIAAGKTMNEVGAVFGLDRDTIYKWIHEGGEEREAAWKAAKRRSADALAEEGMKILDEAEEVTNSAQATVARSRAEYRKWLAGVRNRDDYGPAAGPAVTLNLGIGELHLDALRQRGAMALGEGSEVLEAEVVDEREEGEDVVELLL